MKNKKLKIVTLCVWGLSALLFTDCSGKQTKETEDSPLLGTILKSGKLYVTDSVYSTIKYCIIPQSVQTTEINWEQISDILTPADTLYLKQSCCIRLRGVNGDDYSQEKEYIFDMESLVAEMISHKDPRIENMFVIDPESDLRGTYIVVDGERLPAKAYHSNKLSLAASRGKIISLKLYDEHNSILEAYYPRIEYIEIQTKSE